MSGIDPVSYGALVERVQSLQAEVHELKVDVKLLLEMANKSKGGMWFGMAVVSVVGAFIGYAISIFRVVKGG